LSYAPAASDKVGTNIDYTIRLAPPCAQSTMIFAPSVVIISVRLDLDFEARD
jgi:hypothetical protein